jgi:hypothetical protein
MYYEHTVEPSLQSQMTSFPPARKQVINSYLLCLCHQHGWRQGWGWGKSKDPSTQDVLWGSHSAECQMIQPPCPGLWQPSPTFPKCLLVPPSPLPGPPEQLAFFCKSIIRKEGKRATVEQNKNTELDMWAQHLHLSPRDPGWHRARQPSLQVVHLLPGLGELREICPLPELRHVDLLFAAQRSFCKDQPWKAMG